jgi:hypothetical protein
MARKRWSSRPRVNWRFKSTKKSRNTAIAVFAGRTSPHHRNEVRSSRVYRSAVIYGGSSRKNQIYQCETGTLLLHHMKRILSNESLEFRCGDHHRHARTIERSDHEQRRRCSICYILGKTDPRVYCRYLFLSIEVLDEADRMVRKKNVMFRVESECFYSRF